MNALFPALQPLLPPPAPFRVEWSIDTRYLNERFSFDLDLEADLLGKIEVTVTEPLRSATFLVHPEGRELWERLESRDLYILAALAELAETSS